MFQTASMLVASAALGCGGSAKTASPSPTSATAQPASVAVAADDDAQAILPQELASFDYVWSAIDQSHWEPEAIRERWDTARAELRPKILVAKTKAEANAIMQELIGRLGQSHFMISGAVAPESMPKGGGGTLHFDVRIIDDEVVVWRVRDGAPAAVRPGMIVESVNGQSWRDVLASMRKAGGPESHGSYKEARAASDFTHGAIGTTAAMSLRDGANAKVQVSARWQAPRGATRVNFGHLQGIPLEYESRELGKDIGYIRLSIFFDPVTVNRRFREDIKRFAKKQGLILDLRGNPGGLGAMAMGLGGNLVAKSGSKLGSMISRDSKLDFVLNPQPGAFAGKVAVLVDGQCASTCEIFAAGLEDIGRGVAFGTRTAGAALPSKFEALPNGELFQFATANYVSVSGRVLESDGLTPQRVVPLTRKGLLAGRDEQLEAAAEWIRK